MTELTEEHFEVIDRNREVNHLNKMIAQLKDENNTLSLYNQEYKDRIQQLEKQVVELKQKIQIKEIYEGQKP
jgi:predicted RNase H-like nuclease (RuvC/YqgF family)